MIEDIILIKFVIFTYHRLCKDLSYRIYLVRTTNFSVSMRKLIFLDGQTKPKKLN